MITSVVVTVVTFPIWQRMYAALAVYLEAVLDAQQSGGPPPTFDTTGLFPLRDQVIFTAVTSGRRDALPRGVPALEGRDARAS